MVQVHFVGSDGEETDLDLVEGQSLMEAAVRGGIDGIDADCGGALACATCHVIVSPEWFHRLTPPTPDERAMLEYVVEPAATSRLSCQIELTSELEGLAVTIPSKQS